MNIHEDLNESQIRAVEYCNGPSLVIAGAGSGKTRVLTYKIAYLLEHGYAPYHLLALTFTNKAAREMRIRIGKLVDEGQAAQLWMGTFHSVFARILRIEAQNTGYDANYTIYDESDSKSLVKRIIKEKGFDEKLYKVGNVINRISEAKNRLITPAEYENDRYVRNRDDNAKMPALFEIYKTYCERCRQANAMDFDDLLFNTYFLFKHNDEVRQRWANKFHYVLVDEYQDTNYAQHQIVLQLTHERQRVCVVGDDAQSIYSFRGANIDNILGFTKQYDNVQTFKLERNYRSTKRIVAAANSLIKHNERQIHKDVYSENQEGDRIVIKNAYSDKEEAVIVCKDIRRILRSEGGDYNDFAVLYRTNGQSRTFEEAMRKDGIPYRIYGGLSFYLRKEIKDVLAYFKLICNPADEEAFKRILNYPSRGIGDTTLSKIINCANASHVSLWEVISKPSEMRLEVNASTLAKLEGFRQLILSFQQKLVDTDAYDLGVDVIVRSGIKDEIYSSTEIEDISRQENLQELINSMQDFVESRREEGRAEQTLLTHFVQEVSLLTDADSDKDKTLPRVSLMTIHSAKGLEFPTVFIVGVEENIFPSPMSIGSLRELEEERRLFYVAITRAEKHCIITNAQNRWRYGKMEFDTPSRFLRELDSRFVQRDEMETTDKPRSPREIFGRQTSTFSKPKVVFTPPSNFTKVQSRPQPQSSASSAPKPSLSGLRDGATIEHERFGIGKVIRIEGEGENAKATVEFRNVGIKQLLLKFARFKVIG